MLKDLFRSCSRSDAPAPGRLGAGRRVYAIGDPHGCADRLFALHGRIAADLRDRPVAEPILIHLGDLIDRGPDSAAIVGRLAEGDPVAGCPTVNLVGNHESMMLGALDAPDSDVPGLWLENGGDRSLKSWGVRPSNSVWTWAEVIPPAHVRFLQSLREHHVVDSYLFVHAGVRPGVKLAEQRRHDKLWMREPFLSADQPVLPDRPDLVVVHGHTPAPRPEVKSGRIGVDTGAVKGGRLTCLVLEGEGLHFLDA